jgi:hypothetical protein
MGTKVFTVDERLMNLLAFEQGQAAFIDPSIKRTWGNCQEKTFSRHY